MCIFIGDDVHQFIGNCLIPLDPWVLLFSPIKFLKKYSRHLYGPMDLQNSGLKLDSLFCLYKDMFSTYTAF